LVCLLWVSAGFGQQLSITTVNPTCNTRVQPFSGAMLGNGSITAVASGGTPPYTYDLKLTRPAQSNGYFPGLSSGNYLVEVTDALGNKASQNVFLSETLPDPFLSMKVLQLPTSCTNADGSIELTASGGTPPYLYSWDGGQSFAPTPTVMSGLQQGNAQNFLVKDANGCLAGTGTTSATFQPNYFMCYFCCNLQLSLVEDKAPCNSDGQFTVSIPNAAGPLYYSLDGMTYTVANGTNQNVNTWTNMPPGVYHIYARSADGSLTGQNTWTMVKACPYNDLSFQLGVPSCNNADGSITVLTTFGSPPYTYSMDGVNYQTSNVFSGLRAGTYSLSVKDALGALEAGTTTLKVPSTQNCLQVTATPKNSSCGRPNGSVIVVTSSGTPPYKYSMDGVNYQTSSAFSGLPAGSYTFTAMDASGLSGVTQATVVNTAGPVITAVSAPPFCSNLTGTITVTATGGTAPLQYSLDNGGSWQASGQLPVGTAGQYRLVVADANGCTANTSQVVTIMNAPQVDLGPDLALCTGDSVLLKVPGGQAGDQYLWQDNSTDMKFWVHQPGTYSVAVTNANGCTARDKVTVTGKALPVFGLGPDATVCAGQPVVLDPHSSGVSYLWSTGSTDPSITAASDGLYWLQETLAQCIYRDSITVSYKPVPSVHLGNDTTLCDGQVLLLDATSPGATYLWQDGSRAPEYKVNSAGTYSVQADIAGCRAGDAIVVGYSSPPIVNVVQDTTLCITQELVLDAAWPQSTYLWQDGSTQPQYRVTKEGTYTVEVTNTCGTTEGQTIVKYDNCACRFYMPTAFTPNADGHNDVFRPSYNCLYSRFQMSIFGRWGELVFDTKDPSYGWDGSWQGKQQPAGTYVWVIGYQDQLTGKNYEQKGTVVLIR